MSFEKDIVAHMPSLRRFAMSLTRNKDAAEDAMQDTLVRALQYKDKFEEGTNLRGWLVTILRNTVYSKSRKKQPINDSDGMYSQFMVTRPDQEITIQLHELETLMVGMSEEHKRGLQLVCIEGYSYEEVAEMEGVALGTMKSRVNRARNIIKEELGYIDTDTISIGVQIHNDNIRANHS